MDIGNVEKIAEVIAGTEPTKNSGKTFCFGNVVSVAGNIVMVNINGVTVPTTRLCVAPKVGDRALIAVQDEIWMCLSVVNPTFLDSVATETGSNTNGYWLRYPNSRTQICWRIQSFSGANVSVALGVGFRSSSQYTWTFPQAFSSAPSVTALPSTGIGATCYTANHTSSSIGAYLISFVSSTGADGTISWQAMGRY